MRGAEGKGADKCWGAVEEITSLNLPDSEGAAAWALLLGPRGHLGRSWGGQYFKGNLPFWGPELQS